MAIRGVVQVGDEVLRQKCFPVETFDEKLWALLEDMRDTVKKEQGAGLAAPQVGILRRAVVVFSRFLRLHGHSLLSFLNHCARQFSSCLSA